jgi:hypothetical protein
MFTGNRELDVATLDMLRMVFDNGSYFLINKIENYVPGQSVKVELFKSDVVKNKNLANWLISAYL